MINDTHFYLFIVSVVVIAVVLCVSNTSADVFVCLFFALSISALLALNSECMDGNLFITSLTAVFLPLSLSFSAHPSHLSWAMFSSFNLMFVSFRAFCWMSKYLFILFRYFIVSFFKSVRIRFQQFQVNLN